MSGGIVVVCAASPAHAELAGLPGVDAQSWGRDPRRVQRAHDEIRVRAAVALPTPAHDALARLQAVFGWSQCVLATTAIDGLLQKAGAEDVIELRGSLFRLACAAHPAEHPLVPVSRLQVGDERCEACGSALRPDLAMPGERHRHWERLLGAIVAARKLLCVDLDEAMAVAVAKAARQAPACATFGVGARAGHADAPLDGPSDVVVPRLVEEWLG